MIAWIKREPEISVATALAIVVVAVLVAVIVWAIQSDQAYTDWCESQGGHVHTTTSTGTGISASGKPVVVVGSSSECLTSDGRVIAE